jgi:hypothetical protein
MKFCFLLIVGLIAFTQARAEGRPAAPQPNHSQFVCSEQNTSNTHGGDAQLLLRTLRCDTDKAFSVNALPGDVMLVCCVQK